MSKVTQRTLAHLGRNQLLASGHFGQKPGCVSVHFLLTTGLIYPLKQGVYCEETGHVSGNRNGYVATSSLNTPASVACLGQGACARGQGSPHSGLLQGCLVFRPIVTDLLSYFLLVCCCCCLFVFSILTPFLRSPSIWTDDNVIIPVFF